MKAILQLYTNWFYEKSFLLSHKFEIIKYAILTKSKEQYRITEFF